MTGTRATTPRRGPRLHIDWTTCDGRGLCTELLERRLTRDPWGYPLAVGGGNDLELAPDELEAAREAVALCPRLALRIVER
ncbi:MAG: ferredoxin [Amnibacterium sp.]